jgi:hypothetical protein
MKDYQKWVYDKLSDWQETFRDELRNEEGEDENAAGWTEIEKLKQKLKKGTLTKDDYDSIFFHLWQKIAPEED